MADEGPQAPFAPPPSPSRRGVGSRIVPAQLATYGVVIGTAVALILYLALR
ncbi:MAG: hypothetical protein ABR521_03235 [Gaiellaceae bacterium]